MDLRLQGKEIWKASKLPVAPSVIAIRDTTLPAVNFPLPWAIKPVSEGSSIGISKVVELDQLDEALALAWFYDDRVLIEQWIEGEECTVAILGEEALPVIKIVADQDFYNYESKYLSSTTQYLCPCGLTENQEGQLKELALKAFQTIGATGWGRVDFILDKNNSPYLLEINTVPGMTSHSLVPMAAKAAGITFKQLVKQITHEA